MEFIFAITGQFYHFNHFITSVLLLPLCIDEEMVNFYSWVAFKQCTCTLKQGQESFVPGIKILWLIGRPATNYYALSRISYIGKKTTSVKIPNILLLADKIRIHVLQNFINKGRSNAIEKKILC